jgi:hypothetical protein
MTPFAREGLLFVKHPMIQPASQIVRIIGFALVGLLLELSPVIAQPDQSEHESHHSGVAAPTPSLGLMS